MDSPRTLPKLLGESNCFLEVLEQVSRITRLNRPVLIVGERGTGKELIAERLHYLSDRWSRVLLKMNCAALNQELLESELFGHESGAFTGASRMHKGRFERADGGTLFLDELGTMSIRTQEKLLRFIEYGEFERLGGSTTINTDVRLVAATNIDLPTLADEGRFRHDLLDRLAFDVITLPPLRARQEDILILAEHFALGMCKELNLPFFPGFSDTAKQQLLEHQWPGNIRELRNTIERNVNHWGDNEEPISVIVTDPFKSPYRLKSAETPVLSRIPSGESHSAIPHNTNTMPTQAFPLNFKEKIENLEIELLTEAMRQANYNQRKAAKLLNLTYHQLRGNLKKYRLFTNNVETKDT